MAIPNVWLKTSLPDDAVYDDAGAEVQFAGQGVARAIAEILAARDYETSEPEDWQEMGWSFDASRYDGRFSLLVTKIDDFIVQTHDDTWRLFPNRTPHADFLTILDDALKNDARFSDLRWFDKEWPPAEGTWFERPV